MQTFLTHADFGQSARSLDYRRLGKQRVEAWQILRALAGETRGWVNHPATRMWRGHEGSLARYGIAVCREWVDRGYRDTMLERFVAAADGLDDAPPHWLGREDLHRSHRSNLVRKFPEHYRPLFPGVPDDLEYVWPE